ncbi:hypothetical protein [Leeia aquatica]|uniref:Uncharacterized protein n=1 Tax=Leeia aquatica TaxID=2725557 RepID=A0A847S494_9NEIS|nr:hypothetical protein [Leeia aquatica]NLR73565.1 hypothetical protein [Leeia aquatica]
MLDLPLITTRMKALLASLGMVALTALIAGAGGYAMGHRTAKADGTAALAMLKAQYANALAMASEQARHQEQVLTIRANQLAKQVQQERTRHAEEANQLKRRINRVTSMYRPSLDSPLQPVPRCVFTHGFVGVWNGAIGASSVSSADRATGAADAADTAEALDSGVQPADLLTHITEYGARCRDIESQLNRVIDWVQETQP